MRFTALAAGVLTLVISACATVGSVLESGPSARFETGMAALRAGDYVKANQELGFLAERYPSEPVGQQALLVVSALEMDPRNPARRIALGSELAGAYLRLNKVPKWTEPVAQTMYLLSLELGAAEDKAAQAEAEKAQAERRIESILPRLPQSSSTVPARIKAVTEDRDRMARKIDQLEAQLSDREKKLAEKDKELERIRKTLKS